jgi:hypothetical protein
VLPYGMAGTGKQAAKQATDEGIAVRTTVMSNVVRKRATVLEAAP